MKALEIVDLKKSFRSNFYFRKREVLKGVNLEIENGEIFGFLGPNGAGKTTTIKCILGLLKKDSGTIRIQEEENESLELRTKIGYLPEQPYFYEYLTARELLSFFGQLFRLPTAEIEKRSTELLKLVGLEESANLILRKFSKGMLQRIGIAQALINDPQFLILDEPFSGLDPIGRKEIRELILKLKTEGKTIFFSSHIIQDMELLCDRIAVLFKGKIQKAGKLSELLDKTVMYYEIVCQNISETKLKTIYSSYTFQDNQYYLRLEAGDDLNYIIESIIHNDGRIIAVNPVKKKLEEILLKEFEVSNESLS